jgi:radical SAM superfamily enzyme YgiQ (UPF0313 family)
MQKHPKGIHARVLLTSVFGPYAQDDKFGSRSINPMELYHNQVTREQGPYSLRMFHRSWGIMMIQQNISAPCTVLDFPKLEDFERELRHHQYDVVGISSIIVNVGKAREMARMVREILPAATIVIGGHVTAVKGIEDIIDADHFVRGEGIGWMREFLGEDPSAPVQHAEIMSGYGHRMMGFKLPAQMGSTCATVIPSVGCPLGCNFCTTSAFFGGKGKYQNFFNTGRELFDIMEGLESKLKVHSFFMMDENFLLHRERALDLLKHMQNAGKSWELYVFSSANAIRKYTMEELVQLGVSWVWMGLESPQSGYAKLNGTDTVKMSHDLRSHGIKLLGSTIVGMEHHTPENLPSEIDYACSHETDFHQFMLYTPVPGTPLYNQMEAEGRLVHGDLADIHGQWKFNFEHGKITRDDSKQFLDWAFRRDYELNGPSLYRIVRTTFDGWRRYHNHPDVRIRERFDRELAKLKSSYTGVLWAMERQLKMANVSIALKVRELRKEIQNEVGTGAWLASSVLGPLLLWTVKREARRLARGVTYEPKTVIERRNWA